MQQNKKQVILAGVKPTRVHLGHLISVVDILRTQYMDQDKIVLIGDYHRMFYEKTYAQQEIDQLIRILNNIKCHTFMQSHYAAMFANLLFRLARTCKLSSLNKVFNINFANETENTLGKLLYPFLMTIDIMLCAPCKVVVSQDQIHNVRFAKKLIAEICAEKNIKIEVEFDVLDLKILSIVDDGKMSTSSVKSGALFMDMTQQEVSDVVLRAKTQTVYVTNRDEMSASTLNLFFILSKISDDSIETIAAKFTTFEELKQYAAKTIYAYLNKHYITSTDSTLGVSYKDDFITERFQSNYDLLMV